MKVVQSMKFFVSREGRVWAMVLGAAVASGLLVLSSQLTADGGAKPRSARVTQAEPSLFAGVAQQGAALGSPAAPLTLTEYADLQCPYCAQWARETLPVLVRDYVRTGKLRIVFRGLAFLGPDSHKALRAVHAAGKQNHLWDVVHGLYSRQGAENSGWVSDHVLDEVAEHVSGLDVASFRTANAKEFQATIQGDHRAAQDAGVHGTPSFQLAVDGGRPELITVSSLGPEAIVPTVEAWLGG